MAHKLIARLADGSEHVVKHAGTPEDALKRLTGTERRAEWLDVENGRVRYDSVVGLHVVDHDDEDDDRVINELLHELHARGGATLAEVTQELERRGVQPRPTAPRSS
jgi:hypothetical protein